MNENISTAAEILEYLNHLKATAEANKDKNFKFNRMIKNGVVVHKGATLSRNRINKHLALYQIYATFFSAYPDLYLDLIKPVNSGFHFFFYQRIFLRACVRYRYVYTTAPRAFSKSFISILAIYMICMTRPGAKMFICAPGKEQSAKIAKEKLNEIWGIWPLLEKELEKANFGKDYVELFFRNKSKFDVVGALDSTRGGRRHGGLVDEVRDHDGDTLNEVVLPLMNVSRRTSKGLLNPNEPHQCQFFMTSAGSNASFAYEKLIEVLQNEVIDPTQAFVWGCDYRVPMKCGLLPKDYLQEIKTSSTYKEESFAREYLGLWTGSSEESWFDYEKISKKRVLLNPENSAKIVRDSKSFYLLSVDVGRLSCQTVCCVFKVAPKGDVLYASLVNIYVIGKNDKTRHFELQALELKKIIERFDPREVVIDGNGLGVGLLDFMVRPTVAEDGKVYPPYGSFNDESYIKIQPKDCAKIIYVIKANNSLDGKIHGNCYSRLTSGLVKFLVNERVAKNKLMEHKNYNALSLEKKVLRLMPHEMTSGLFEEMSNLRLKQNTGLEIRLEQIRAHKSKDKFSAFEYGLWRIKELEEQLIKKRRKGQVRSLVFIG